MMQVVVEGVVLDVPYQRIRVDALMEKAGLIEHAGRSIPTGNLVLIDFERRRFVEYPCLHDVIEVFQGMTFLMTYPL
ncbi:MAG: hypothetical protein AAGB19_17635 [Cyanobacteria bacterium P01_F01_bin.3]